MDISLFANTVLSAATQGGAWFAPWPEVFEALLRLLAAMACGGLVGLERQLRGQDAGLRTQILVTVGACLAMLVSLHFAEIFGARTGAIRVDPARVAYGVMTGVGFLGAGAIIREKFGVRGLTTAATLWCIAAVGLACGFGMFLVAATATAVVLFALVALRVLDRLLPARQVRYLHAEASIDVQQFPQRLRAILEGRGASVRDMNFWRDAEKGTQGVAARLSVSYSAGLDLLPLAEREIEGIREISLR
jgi:putative Mg2+ transporter-C (MgtC) family protein